MIGHEHVVTGAVWRDKRDHWRRVEILEVDLDRNRVHVLRNTSRRTQPIAVATLLRSYEPWITNAQVAKS